MSQTGPVAVAESRRTRKSRDAASLLDKFGLNPDAMSPVERRGAISGYDMRYRIEALVAGVTAKKIKHVYVGDGAATAPGVMYLPLIPAASLFPMRHVRVLLGYTAHEISHQLKTDFGLLTALIADPTSSDLRKQQLKQFWNAIEDYRIEKLVRKDYPGFHVFIDDTRDFTARRFVERVDAGQVDAETLSNPYRIGSVALTWVGARLNGYRTRTHEDALNRLEPDLKTWIESWEPDMARVMTCVEARDLAAEILDELDRLRQHQPPQPQPQNGQSQNGQPQKGQGQPGQGQPGQAQGQSDGASTGEPDGAPSDKTDEKGGDQPGGGETAPKDDAGTSKGDGKDADGKGRDTAEEGDGRKDAAGKGDQTQPDEADQDGDGAGEGDGEPGDGQSGSDTGSGGDGSQAEGRPSSGGNQSQGGSGAPRPQLSVKDGDEKAQAEESDLQIDDLQKAINSMKGAKAKDPKIADADGLTKMAKSGKKETDLQTVQRGQSKYAAIKRSIASPAARAAGVMRRLLQSTAKRRWNGGREDGELDFRRLVPILNGDPDVHRQLEVRRSVNSALLLLLDNSGSMTGHPIQVCQETAVVLDMAVSGTPTNVEITGFTGSRERPTLYRYRAFGQKGQAAAATLGNMDEVPLGGTPVSIPLLEGWRRLSAQKEPRRIIILVSDGGAEDAEEAREAHDFVVAQGCIVLGIAIGHDAAMRHWCDRVHAIESVDQLPTALTMLIQGVLR